MQKLLTQTKYQKLSNVTQLYFKLIHFIEISIVPAKEMLVVSHKILFMENEAAFLWVTKPKRARSFAATT